MHIAEINILFSMFDERCRNNSFVIVMKIKEFYIDDISSIVVMSNLLCRKCKRNKWKINDFNCVNEDLKSILLLFNEFNVLIIDIVEHDKQRDWDMLIESK